MIQPKHYSGCTRIRQFNSHQKNQGQKVFWGWVQLPGQLGQPGQRICQWVVDDAFSLRGQNITENLLD